MIERFVIQRLLVVVAVIISFLIAFGSFYLLIPDVASGPSALPPSEIGGGGERGWKTW